MPDAIVIEPCPGQLKWSAFGASYPDSRCAQTTGGYFLETNEPMNRAMEGMGGKIVKRYRLYEKAV